MRAIGPASNLSTSIRDIRFAGWSKAGAAAPAALLALWVVYLLLAPTIGFAWIDSWHNEQRAVQLLLLSLTAVLYATSAVFGTDAWRAHLQPALWWLAFLGLGVVSALTAQVPFAALAEVGLFAMLGSLVLLTAALTASRPAEMARAARYCAMLIAGAHVLAVSVRFFAAMNLGNGVHLDVFMLGYANPRFASALYAVLMPFVAAVAVDQREHHSLRVAALMSLSLLWTINLGLGTRGIWFAFGLAAPALLMLIGGRALIRIIGANVLAAAIGSLVFIGLMAVPGSEGSAATVSQLSVERLQTLTSREVLWALSWEAIVRHPLLGLGPMHFATLESHVGAHPHNWLLQVAAEWGLPALAVLLFGLLTTARALRHARTLESGYSREAVLAVSVTLAYGLVDGNLVLPVSQTTSALALGLAIGSLAGAVKPRSAWPSPALAGLTIAAAVTLSAFASQSFADQPRAAATFRAKHPTAWLVPRFWESGFPLPP